MTGALTWLFAFVVGGLVLLWMCRPTRNRRVLDTLRSYARVIFPPLYDDEVEVIHDHWDGYTLDDEWAEAQGHMIPAPPVQASEKTAWGVVASQMACTTMPNNRRSWFKRIMS